MKYKLLPGGRRGGVKYKLRTDTVGKGGVVINGESGGEYTHSRNFIGKMFKNMLQCVYVA